MSEGVRFTPRSTHRKWVVFAAVGSSYFVTVAAMTFSVLALPAIADDFEVTLKTAGWVVIIESLIIAALLLPLGRLSDIVGRHRTLRVGIAVFGLGLILSGVASSFGFLIVSRVVIALGNTLVQAVGTGTLVAAFPSEERGLALAGQTTAVALGAALGPLLGGLLLDQVEWRVLFIALAALTGVVFVIAHIALGSESAEGPAVRRRFDGIGAFLAAAFIAVLVLTVNDPFEFGWGSPVTVAGGLLAAGLLVQFIWTELDHASPMLDLRLFQIGDFRNAVSIRLVAFTASSVINFLAAIYLLGVRGLSTRSAGVILAFFAIGMVIGAQVSGRLYDRLGPRLPMVVGLLVQISVFGLLVSVGEATPAFLVGIATFGSGLGQGLWNVPANSVMMGAMPADSLGVGGAFTNVTRTVGSVIGQAGATAIVAGVMASRGFDIPLGDVRDTPGAAGAFVGGWRATYLACLGITAIALAIASRTGSTPSQPVASATTSVQQQPE